MAQTKRELQAVLAAAGVRLRKRFGQHFLVDGNLLNKLVRAAGIGRDDVVLEVGPGTGSLTEKLLEVSGCVVAVEIDRGLTGICRSRLGTCDRLALMGGDVLARKKAVAGEVLQRLAAERKVRGGRIILVANLPYQVATPLLVDLLLGELTVSPMCFTVQAEVGERLLAAPGGKTYGPVSVLVQALATVKRIARVPREAFWPVPKVDSTMLRVEVRDAGRPAPAVRGPLAEVVHACFNYRRKTIKFSLRKLLDEATFQRVGADGRWNLSDRPERITVAQWVELAEFLSLESGHERAGDHGGSVGGSVSGRAVLRPGDRASSG